MKETRNNATEVSRESLAWVAGVFDGEGHVRASGTRIFLEVSQAGEELPLLLERVRGAVGFGNINGPYSKGAHKPSWRYRANSYEQVQAFTAMVWPWLGPVKRTQAANALGEANRSYVGRGKHERPNVCKRGHPFDGSRRTVSGFSRTCSLCVRRSAAQHRAKLRGVSK